jgi:hypothetical protein
MNTRNQITITVIRNETGKQDSKISQWIQFFKVHNFYANKTTRQIEHYLRKYRIYIAFRGREVVEKMNELYFILLQKLTQSRLLQPHRMQITFTLTKE